MSAISAKITDSEKEIYSSISKYSKSLDKVSTLSCDQREALLTLKTFRLDLSNAFNPEMFPIEPSDDLNQAVIMHFARNGHFDIAKTFMGEVDANVPAMLLEQFSVMYDIVQAIRKEELQPAIEWAYFKRNDLLARGSNLEFVLHKVQFARILQRTGNPSLALNYARENLSVFGDRYFSEIARLMSSILYYKNIARSPYEDVYELPSNDKLSWMFLSEFCFLLGLSPESPIYLAVTAGSLALPVLAKLDSLMKNKKAEWTSSNELPTEVPLPSSLIFHSIFVCPVSKEQTTEENPPKVLPCGHILANNSLKSMRKDTASQNIKCPYCPMDTSYEQAKRVYF